MIGLGLLFIFVLYDDFAFFLLGILLIACGAIFTPGMLLICKISQKNAGKSMAIISDETVDCFGFDENKYYLTQTRGDDYKAHTEAAYSYRYQIREDKEHYFLFISNNQSHVINKADLVSGSLEELENIFTAKLGARYKRR